VALVLAAGEQRHAFGVKLGPNPRRGLDGGLGFRQPVLRSAIPRGAKLGISRTETNLRRIERGALIFVAREIGIRRVC